MLELNNLSVSFYNQTEEIRAVRNISFGILKQEIVALVGESGCGKTVSALSITKLIPENIAAITGRVMFKGEDLLNFDKEKIRKIRGGKISYVFQEPTTSLNPVNTVGSQIVEAIMLHQNKTKKEAYDLALSLLNEVGIYSAKERFNSYPHQFSGGMNQRVMIAMALSSNPELLIADEPTTALDVTVQAQILRLLLSLKKQRALAMLFITHNLNIVSQFADKIVVMYAGKIVEILNKDIISDSSNHPYTLGLFRCIPKANKAKGRLDVIKGEIPSVSNLPSGCIFNPRCPEAIAKCREADPVLKELTPAHKTACHLRF